MALINNGDYIGRIVCEEDDEDSIYHVYEEERFIQLISKDRYPNFVDESLYLFGVRKTGTFSYNMTSSRCYIGYVVSNISYMKVPNKTCKRYIIALLLLGADLNSVKFIETEHGIRVINIKKFKPIHISSTMSLIPNKYLVLFPDEDTTKYICKLFRDIDLEKFESRLRHIRERLEIEDEIYEKAIIRRIRSFIL